MRWFLVMMLAAGLVGCGDDGGSDGEDEEASRAAFEFDYGVSADQYGEGCKEFDEMGRLVVEDHLYLGDDPVVADLPTFTPCRLEENVCEGVYGEEGTLVLIEIEDTTGYKKSTFRLLRDDEIVASGQVDETPRGPEQLELELEPPSGSSWTDGEFRVEIEGGGSWGVEVWQFTKTYRIIPSCLPRE